MNVKMLGENDLLSEPLIADVTSVIFLAGMDRKVSHESVLQRKSLVADLADKRLLSCVSPNVPIKGALVREPPVTERAWIAFYTKMSLHMLD